MNEITKSIKLLGFCLKCINSSIKKLTYYYDTADITYVN